MHNIADHRTYQDVYTGSYLNGPRLREGHQPWAFIASQQVDASVIAGEAYPAPPSGNGTDDASMATQVFVGPNALGPV